MGSLSNLEGAGQPEKVSRQKVTLCPTCGQPTPEAGPRAAPEFEPPESVRVLEERIHDQIRDQFPDFKYHIWLRPLRLLWRQGEHLTFTAPAHIRVSFEERYLTVVIRLLQEAGWGSVTGEVVAEDWRPSPEQLAAGPSCEPAAAPAGSGAAAPAEEIVYQVTEKGTAAAEEMRAQAAGLALSVSDPGALADSIEKVLEEGVDETVKAIRAAPAQPRRRRRSDVTR